MQSVIHYLITSSIPSSCVTYETIVLAFENQINIVTSPLSISKDGFLIWTPLWVQFPQGHLILSCEEAVQLAYGTSMVPLSCPFESEIIQGEKQEPPVKLESRHITFRVLMRRKTQSKQIELEASMIEIILENNKTMWHDKYISFCFSEWISLTYKTVTFLL